MFVQFAIGTALILATLLLTGLSFWGLEVVMDRYRRWLSQPPHRPKLILTLSSLSLWVVIQFSIAVWLWALALLWLDVFDALEPAVYFSLVAFTTLGFGDILLPEEWRLLSGLAAGNGLMHFGLMTAILVEGVRQIRQRQIAHLKDDP